MENKKSQGLQLRDLSSLLKRFGLLFVLILMFLVMTIVSDVFLTTNNIINVLRQISINGVLAVGLTFVILTGGIDLSVGSLVAVTSVIAGNLLEKEMNVPLVLFLSIGAAVLFGVFNGVLISYFMLPPFIATLATQTIGRGFSLVYSDGRPYTIKNEMYKAIGKGVFIGIPIPVWIMFFVIVTDIEVLQSQTANWKRAEAMALAETWLTQYQDLDAIICQNDDMAMGALEAAEGMGRKEGLIIIGIDAITDAVAAVADGRLDATVFQDAAGQGAGALDVAIACARDGLLKTDDVMIPFLPVTIENIADFM
jgi:ABC-type xylose transport system permease subunit